MEQMSRRWWKNVDWKEFMGYKRNVQMVSAPAVSTFKAKSKPEGIEFSFELYLLRDLIAKKAINLDLVHEYVKEQGHEVSKSKLNEILVEDATSKVAPRISPIEVSVLRQAAIGIISDN